MAHGAEETVTTFITCLCYFLKFLYCFCTESGHGSLAIIVTVLCGLHWVGSVKPHLHQDNMLPVEQHVAVNIYATSCSFGQHVACISAEMNSNYLFMSRSTCSLSLCIQQQTGNKLAICCRNTSNMLTAPGHVAGNMLPGNMQHVALV